MSGQHSQNAQPQQEALRRGIRQALLPEAEYAVEIAARSAASTRDGVAFALEIVAGDRAGRRVPIRLHLAADDPNMATIVRRNGNVLLAWADLFGIGETRSPLDLVRKLRFTQRERGDRLIATIRPVRSRRSRWRGYELTAVRLEVRA